MAVVEIGFGFIGFRPVFLEFNEGIVLDCTFLILGKIFATQYPFFEFFLFFFRFFYSLALNLELDTSGTFFLILTDLFQRSASRQGWRFQATSGIRILFSLRQCQYLGPSDLATY